MLLVLAASLIPFTKIEVTTHVIKNAGKLIANPEKLVFE